ncbi:hypothetical protein QR665_14770 [Acinetobacter gerneri]|uniref:hypothetical protein n=1 Tax=Acinetobacter gerneri TaxID=202952 RepID=UPI002936425F|nr:hypothetical protein [Acinetobacter gerneri]MDV2440722.1 hypothetical protein [Acinetobacter gerneri]
MFDNVKKWWKGTDAIRSQDQNTGQMKIIKPAKRPLIVNIIGNISIVLKNIYIFFIKEWKALIPILFTILNFIYAHSIDQSNKKNNEEYKRCEVQTESNKSVIIKCLK